eukprot:scaffold8029_cov170-Amphora_coffeaeformis.AAC.7
MRLVKWQSYNNSVLKPERYKRDLKPDCPFYFLRNDCSVVSGPVPLLRCLQRCVNNFPNLKKTTVFQSSDAVKRVPKEIRTTKLRATQSVSTIGRVNGKRQ